MDIQVKFNIPSRTLSYLIGAAIEGYDPVTIDWCRNIVLISCAESVKNDSPFWYDDPSIFEHSFVIKVAEYDDHNKYSLIEHVCDNLSFENGLVLMATELTDTFSKILKCDFDAGVADVFLQYVVFGEVKYG